MPLQNTHTNCEIRTHAHSHPYKTEENVMHIEITILSTASAAHTVLHEDGLLGAGAYAERW